MARIESARTACGINRSSEESDFTVYSRERLDPSMSEIRMFRQNALIRSFRFLPFELIAGFVGATVLRIWRDKKAFAGL